MTLYLIFLIIINNFVFIKTTEFYNGINDHCSLYFCSEDKLKNKKCLISTNDTLEEFNYTIKESCFILNCPKDEKCLKVPNENYGICTKKNIENLFEGNKCNTNNECASKICKNNKCIGKENGEECISNLECKSQSSCLIKDLKLNKGTCENLVNLGEECIFLSNNPYQSNCKFNLICADTTENQNLGKVNFSEKIIQKGKCIEMGKINNGKKSNNKLACYNGMLYNENGFFVCGEYINSNNYCNKNYQVCNSSILTNFKNEYIVDCLITSLNHFVCPNLEISKNFRNYINLRNEIIKNMNGDNFFVTKYRESLNHLEIAKLFVKYEFYGFIQDADSCVFNYFLDLNYSIFLKGNYYLFFMIIFLILF
jgi:hypothetical protein